MQMNDDTIEFYRAHLARDPRFDGKFFVAVKTTGIYCRPICPARKAKLHNLTFFRTAAEAIAAGYRPCLRCHPESAPGSAAWLGTAAVVQQALRLMDVQALEAFSITTLAAQLGVGVRWLRSLFQQQVGASPQAILLTKKLDLARNLLDTSTLPIIDIAFGSGFQSLRRFNDAFKKQFRQTPSAFRQKSTGEGQLSLCLNYRPPYDYHTLLQYLQSRAISAIERVDKASYQRLFTYGVVRGWFKVTFGKGAHIAVECKTDQPFNILEFVARLKNLFDLDADPMAIARVLQEEACLAPYVKKQAGLRVPGCWDGFELAVRAIVGQRISVKAAHCILERIVAHCGEMQQLDLQLPLQRYFPTPEQMLNADLSGIGLPTARIETLKILAKKMSERQLMLDGTTEETVVRQQLLSIKGIGLWTVEYIAMRALKNPNAFPETDLVIQKRIQQLGVNPENWIPWRAYGAILLFTL